VRTIKTNKLKLTLLKRLAINEETECWEITGYYDKDGYGEISHKRAHRLAYELFKGEIPENMNVCHRCDNPKCCNPEHLFIGTQKDNIRDMVVKGRKSSRLGIKNTQNKLTETQVLEIYEDKDTQRNIAKQYNIDQSTVSNIKSGKLWGWLTHEKVLAV
jgi:hypothetical protein